MLYKRYFLLFCITSFSLYAADNTPLKKHRKDQCKSTKVGKTKEYICYTCVNYLLNNQNGKVYPENNSFFKSSSKIHEQKNTTPHNCTIDTLLLSTYYCKKHCTYAIKHNITPEHLKQHVYHTHVPRMTDLHATKTQTPITSESAIVLNNFSAPIDPNTVQTNSTSSLNQRDQKHTIAYLLN